MGHIRPSQVDCIYIYIYTQTYIHIFTNQTVNEPIPSLPFFCGAVVVIVLHIHRYIGKSVTFLTKPVDISYSEEIYKKTGARFDKQRGRNGRMNQYW